MKIISRTLVAGAAIAVMTACNNGDNNEDINVNDGMNDANHNNDAEMNEDNEDDNENNNDDNNMNDMNNNDQDEDNGGEEAETGSNPVENVSHDDGVLSYEYDGTSGEVDAELMETEFGKEIAMPDGMSMEEDEEGTHRIVHLSAEDGSDLEGLHISLREGFNYEGEEILTQQVDTERSAELQGSVLGSAGHVNSFETVHLDDDTPFHFYFHVEGDASEPGHFPESVDGEEYEQFKFYEIVEEGYYYVDVMLPAGSDAEVTGAGLAVASTFSPEGTTLEEDEAEDDGESEEE
ncbi:hypothetical protein [Salisediminibacterium beveridgei]|uniref:Spore germination protein-like n=1 Tax=Salisediminibacterium beveridgei TaxID=632773 RepID=A0A1D7QXD3_9BACI|nr:hypothetical protein [Salisediminibacterium beveridgei]AOM83683.1 spore germination protein-like [Salisediminibacterium beveridgei]